MLVNCSSLGYWSGCVQLLTDIWGKYIGHFVQQEYWYHIQVSITLGVNLFGDFMLVM